MYEEKPAEGSWEGPPTGASLYQGQDDYQTMAS